MISPRTEPFWRKQWVNYILYFNNLQAQNYECTIYVCVCFLKEEVIVLLINFYSLAILSSYSKENYQKPLIVSRVSESTWFEYNELNPVMNKKEHLKPWYAYGPALSKRTSCDGVNMVATSNSWYWGFEIWVLWLSSSVINLIWFWLIEIKI